MSVELNEPFFAKVAGWEAMKMARALLAMGKVLSSNYTPPILKGVVQEGTTSYRAGFVIKSDTDLENTCTCRASREWGTMCSHSVAVGLHWLKPAATEKTWGKTAAEKISIPVLFGMNGKAAKSFEADAYHSHFKLVLEVEAGRAVTNYQFLKDIFQASVMVDVDYLCIAVRNIYRKSADFNKVYMFLDTLYTSGRIRFPLKGILVVGY